MYVLKKIMEKVFEISSSGKNKDRLKRYEEVWSKIKDFIISINDNSDVVTYLQLLDLFSNDYKQNYLPIFIDYGLYKLAR